MKRRPVAPPEGEAGAAFSDESAVGEEKQGEGGGGASTFRPMDHRRIREIRHWLEGNRPDAPTVEELREFVAWVSQEIEFALARHHPICDLVGFLNAARQELRRAGAAA